MVAFHTARGPETLNNRKSAKGGLFLHCVTSASIGLLQEKAGELQEIDGDYVRLRFPAPQIGRSRICAV